MSNSEAISKRILVKNFGAQLASTTIRMGATAIISILIARLLGVAAYGKYAAITAFVMIFNFAVDWGMSQLVIREIAKEPDNVSNFVSACLYILAVTSVLSLVMIFIADQMLDVSGGNRRLLLLASLWLVLGVVGFFFSGVFIAVEKMEYDTISALTEASIDLILILIVMHDQLRNLESVITVLILGRVISLLISILIYRRFIGKIKYQTSTPLIRSIILMTIPFGLQILLSTPTNLLIIILNKFRGDADTGQLKAAQTIILLTGLLATLIGNVLYPRLSRYYGRSREAYKALLQKSIHYMLIASLPITIGLFMLARQIIVLLYGSAYLVSTSYVRLMSPSLPLTFLGTVLAIAITSSNRQGQRTAILALIAISNLILGLLLIPSYGAVGASLTLTLDRLLSLIFFLIIIVKISGWPYKLRLAAPILLSTTIMGAFIWLAQIRLSLLILVPVAGCIYGLTLFATDGVVRQDLRQIQLINLIRSNWRHNE